MLVRANTSGTPSIHPPDFNPTIGASTARYELLLTSWTPRLLSVLRIVSAFLFMSHGMQKWLGFPVPFSSPITLWSLVGVAGLMELVGGFLLLIGLFTRPVAFLLSGEMAFAYFIAHAPQGFWPIVNRGELAALYCFLFLFLRRGAARGASTAGCGADRQSPRDERRSITETVPVRRLNPCRIARACAAPAPAAPVAQTHLALAFGRRQRFSQHRTDARRVLASQTWARAGRRRAGDKAAIARGSRPRRPARSARWSRTAP
jgi:putative oxidoreductase